jgi:hypothetical protein
MSSALLPGSVSLIRQKHSQTLSVGPYPSRPSPLGMQLRAEMQKSEATVVGMHERQQSTRYARIHAYRNTSHWNVIQSRHCVSRSKLLERP